MKNKILLIGIIIFMALPKPVWAADIAGNWIAHEPNVHGITLENVFFVLKAELAETIFSFNVDGSKLAGTVTNLEGKTAINGGLINSDEISFFVIRSFEGNAAKLVYKGKVNLNEIKFIREVQGGTGQSQEFVAKREFQRNNGFVPFQKAAAVPPLPQKP